jgi:hypothetical protein
VELAERGDADNPQDRLKELRA